MFWFWNRNYFHWDQSGWNVCTLFLLSLASLGSSWFHPHLISCLCLFLIIHVSLLLDTFFCFVLFFVFAIAIKAPGSLLLRKEPIRATLWAALSILWRTEAILSTLSPPTSVLEGPAKPKAATSCPCMQPMHSPLTVLHAVGHDTTPPWWTRPHQALGDLHSTGLMYAWGTSKAGLGAVACCSWHPTDHSLALFCINPCRCSTSSGVMSTHGFSLRFPPRRAWCGQCSISASLWLF